MTWEVDGPLGAGDRSQPRDDRGRFLAHPDGYSEPPEPQYDHEIEQDANGVSCCVEHAAEAASPSPEPLDVVAEIRGMSIKGRGVFAQGYAQARADIIDRLEARARLLEDS